ncbi:MAG: 3-keto-disaccharide hydrolase, partial [Flavobacteriaceae bacterium]
MAHYLITSSTRILFILIPALIFLNSCRPDPIVEPWESLFDGEKLDGWSIKGGEAIYEVRDGQIIGKTVRNTPNTFLTSDRHFGDFILELEYKVDPSMNSGIQIRSQSLPYYRNGTVHGYQVEIDPSERAWSAGIYEEQRRGWLHPITENQKAQEAFNQNDWNHYRVEAIGDTIKTWINGVAAAHLVDENSDSGFIGLQVHSINEDQEEGTEVIWKNIQIITDSLAVYSKTSPLPAVITKNQLLHSQEENGWQLLWDGKTTNGWRGAKLDSFPDEGWTIENGELIVLASGGGESAAGGDIVTLEEFEDFELQLEFKITEGANSGIK